MYDRKVMAPGGKLLTGICLLSTIWESQSARSLRIENGLIKDPSTTEVSGEFDVETNSGVGFFVPENVDFSAYESHSTKKKNKEGHDVNTEETSVSYRISQIHMAQGADPTSMTISWTTPTPPASVLSSIPFSAVGDRGQYTATVPDGDNSANAGLSALPGSQVRFSLSPDMKYKTSTAYGYSQLYTFNYPHLPGYTSGLIHHVTLRDLVPNTVYYYQVGDFYAFESTQYASSAGGSSGDGDNTNNGSPVSGVLSFTTMREVGDLSSFSMAVIGDLGQTTDSLSTVDHMLENKDLGMILHAGKNFVFLR
jgi:Purple acid Phosphatase, N-terminal domain